MRYIALLLALAACGSTAPTGTVVDGAVVTDAGVPADAWRQCILRGLYECLPVYAPDGGRLLFEQTCVCPSTHHCSTDPVSYGSCYPN